MAALQQYDWLIAIISIAFCGSTFGNGANDVANAYATSVAARTLTMPQVGVLSVITEFVGAVALGSRVTGTIKNDIIDLNRFTDTPSVLILVMTCAEIGSAFWLLLATRLGFPVSTTQTIVGALVGAGIASQAQVSWDWESEGVSWDWESEGVAQVAASWGVAPALSACFAAILFATLKFCILEREDPFGKAMKAIPFYLAFTGAVLALFITIEAPGAPSLEEIGAGTAVGIVLGVFFGVLLVAYAFFVPYFRRRLIMKDTRVRPWHIILGPLLLRENPHLFFPGKDNAVVIDYYESAHDESNSLKENMSGGEKPTERDGGGNVTVGENNGSNDQKPTPGSLGDVERGEVVVQDGAVIRRLKRKPEPEERFLAPTAHLPIAHPKRILAYTKYILLQGVTRDCVTHSSARLEAVHSKAKRYDNRVEHLWTYAQVASAIMMSIAHGSNDVANAVGPWVAAYQTYQSGVVSEDSDTPVWILVIAGLLLGAGFWFMGFRIIRSLGNKITQMSPTRGFSAELGAAITVLLASRLGLPVSTTQCLTGAVLGVSFMNFDFGATNWKQMAFIFCGWVLTLPSAGLIAGLLTVMALNTPHFT
ncbi:Phosphate-repressible phosphate permease pho-4 [Madurella mycetomatis]|uniref:Phosphate transporter n=1 Tax=Madurella mycetomatis TaxID=100816 RepID=A0A175W185_9PEZI|nr:Phosphate-repressible phosphate permease pho-4 [Madurella mycetomatis]